MTEPELLEEKQIIETEARKLTIKEELAKAKARFLAYHDIPIDNIQIKQESAQQRSEYQRQKMSSARDHKHQQANIYNEDQLQNGTKLITGLKRRKTNPTRRQATRSC